MEQNPLLTASAAPYGAPAFDLIRTEHYMPAFKEGIRLAKEEIDAIASNPEEPTFSNTIEALEYSGEALDRVEGIFFNILEADSSDELQQLAEEVSPMLTELSMYISLNRELFKRVRSVYDSKPSLPEDAQRLLEKTYKGFVRGGAALEGEDRERYSKMSEELSLLELKFGNNVLAATNAWYLHLTEEKDLAGLPQYVVDGAASEAAAKGLQGWVFTLQQPSYRPFMKFSTRRDLRKKIWEKYNTRGIGGEQDNTSVILRIAELRMKIANILGYPAYADYALERRMAKNVDTVNGFIHKLMEPSMPKAVAEMDEVLAFAKQNGFEGDRIEPWDFFYWSEKLQDARFSINEGLLKPYFRLENVIDAVFGLATKLYGLSFQPAPDVPVYHKDVKVYDVKDENGCHLALFYADFFPRESKRGGAWMTEFRGQYQKDGQDFRPFISIVTNFSKPTPSAPSLLTHMELTTFLHEFGHALHGMLSRGRYPSMCGTNVARDFVELPSQIMENWGFEPEYLDTFARHYQTGETIPHKLIDSISAARNFMAAYLQVRQLRFCVIDMAWHTLKSLPADAVAFEHEVLAPYMVYAPESDPAHCPSFGHIFSGGYSAGYYSYKWAEVLEADAFDLFREKGIFNTCTAADFRHKLLERGSSADEATLYRDFRGHDPEPEALLRKLGII